MQDSPLVDALVVALVVALTCRPRRRRAPSRYRQRRWDRILAAASQSEARTGKELAHDAGLKPDAALRGDLAELIRQGKLTRARGEWGYRRCSSDSEVSQTTSGDT